MEIKAISKVVCMLQHYISVADTYGLKGAYVNIIPNYILNKLHRSQVLAFKSSKQSRQLTCFADCSENVSLVSFSSIIKQYIAMSFLV